MKLVMSSVMMIKMGSISCLDFCTGVVVLRNNRSGMTLSDSTQLDYRRRSKKKKKFESKLFEWTFVPVLFFFLFSFDFDVVDNEQKEQSGRTHVSKQE